MYNRENNRMPDCAWIIIHLMIFRIYMKRLRFQIRNGETAKRTSWWQKKKKKSNKKNNNESSIWPPSVIRVLWNKVKIKILNWTITSVRNVVLMRGAVKINGFLLEFNFPLVLNRLQASRQKKGLMCEKEWKVKGYLSD